MKVSLTNVGRFFKPIDVDINGITVLAGENGTGKSTIGKVIYCVYNCFYNYEYKIMTERVASIYSAIRMFSRNKVLMRHDNGNIRNRIEKIIYLYNENHDIANVYNKLVEIVDLDVADMPQELKDRINDALNATDEEILDTILGRIISQEFGSQLGHVNYKDHEAVVQVNIKDKLIDFRQIKGKKPHINNKIDLVKEVVYVDDPYILDDVQDAVYGSVYSRNVYSHRRNLIHKILGREKNDFSAVDDVVITRSLEELFSKISMVCAGELRSNDDGDMTYEDDTLKEGISLANLSTGLKSFVILKTLLQKGYLERNGILVLDEPETHQHPEWMKIYAEFVVLLQKHLGINIVISTHSAEFLSFIELYTKKYDITEKCKYYLLSIDPSDNSMSVIDDVSEKLDMIYSRLAEPFLQGNEEFDAINES